MTACADTCQCPAIFPPKYQALAADCNSRDVASPVNFCKCNCKCTLYRFDGGLHAPLDSSIYGCIICTMGTFPSHVISISLGTNH